MLFDSWTGLLRVLVVGVLTYAALVLLLRVSGKRTLSKMNAFDLVVTVALGSTLASALLTKDVAAAEGILGLALLISLQYVVAWLSVRSAAIRRLVKSEPQLLVWRGRILEAALRQERLTREEILAALRSSGNASIRGVGAVVLETDGTLSVMQDSQDPADTLAGVRTPEGHSP